MKDGNDQFDQVELVERICRWRVKQAGLHRACFHFDLKIKMTAMIVIMMSTIMMMIIGVKDNDVARGRSRHKEVPVCCFARSGGDETRGRLSLRLDQPSIHLFDTVFLSQCVDDDYLPKTLSNLLAKKNILWKVCQIYFSWSKYQ